MPVVVLIEASAEGPKGASLPAITAARELASHHGGPLVGVILGPTAKTAAPAAAAYVDQILCVEHPALATPLAETWAPALVASVKAVGASVLVASATSTGKDVLPRATALLGAGMASDVVAVLGPRGFRRPTYAGNALCEIEVTTPTVVVSVRQTAFPAAAPAATAGTVASLDPAQLGTLDALGAEVLGVHGTTSARPDLTEAKVVVSGGRGMRAGENFKILEELTDLLGGALGASRAACDAGMVPNDLQVGQTGKVVAPQLYIAVAISGAIQHLAGMKGSKVIVAINKDAEAPIFQVADYGLVATWEAAIPALIAALRQRRA